MQNLVERTSKHKKDNADNDNEEEKKKRPIIKSATDLQRLKLEKLMKNPDKPVIIPESPREKDYMQTVPSFVRNVMGSSAGAGSGEFHVYRHLRRKEYARQKCIHAKSMREQLDDEYQSKLEKNRLEADAKTAKKRAKRLKKKQRAKKPESDETEKPNDTDTDDDEDEDEEALEKKENDSEICQDTAGPAPKDDINDIRNEDKPIQNETLNTCLNTDKSSQDNQEKNENDKQISTETKEQPETEDVVDGTEKQKVDVEDKATDEQIKEPKLLES